MLLMNSQLSVSVSFLSVVCMDNHLLKFVITWLAYCERFYKVTCCILGFSSDVVMKCLSVHCSLADFLAY